MPLTPEDVANVRFRTARRGGYDEQDVDKFIDQVVAELQRLDARIAELEAAQSNR